jgi:ribonuclease T1
VCANVRRSTRLDLLSALRLHEGMSEAPQRRKVGLILAGCVALAVVAIAFFLIGKSTSSKSSATTSASKAPAGPVSSTKTSSGNGSNSSGGSPTSALAKDATTVAQAPAGANVGKSGLKTVKPSALPPEARITLKLIDANGPFPYSRDGVTFKNLEKILPKQPNGYYHEYTVVTPGSKDRGARRIIAGEKGERFYTDDHYASFKEVVG